VQYGIHEISFIYEKPKRRIAMGWECACGIINSDGSSKCKGCGWTRTQSKEFYERNIATQGVSPSSIGDDTVKDYMGLFTFIGFILGAFMGFIARPTIPLLGQLPFMVVVTRGAYLQGADRLLIGVAETSFNYMLIGGIGMAVLGLIVGNAISYSKKHIQYQQPIGDTSYKHPTNEIIKTTKDKNNTDILFYCEYCGSGVPGRGKFCPSCGKAVA
jgi:hypothetical protein